MTSNQIDELRKSLDSTLHGLKNFQTATVDFLYRRMFRENRYRMLVADEVGLGKTIVARGLLARLIQDRIGQRVSPLRVVYICSNLVIAKDNIAKLHPLPDKRGDGPTPSRIGHLAYKAYAPRDEDESQIQLNAFTPGTSFQVTSGIGERWERAAVYGALCQDPEMKKLRSGLQWLVRGGIEKFDRYRRELRSVEKGSSEWTRLRPDFPRRFISNAKKVRLSKGRTLYDETLALARALTGKRSWNERRAEADTLDIDLRRCLVETCRDYLDADIYILDEFQRFRQLIDPDSSTDEATLAQSVFGRRSDSRILLLSATPFKPFTGIADQLAGEDHYADFKQLLRFLLADDSERLIEYEQHRRALFRQLLDLKQGEAATVEVTHREAVEAILGTVMCRTERNSVSIDAGAMVADTWKWDRRPYAVPVLLNDLESFRATDQLSLALDKLENTARIPVPLEYCKSSPVPLSFMEHYKFKTAMKGNLSLLAGVLESASAAWLDMGRTNTYSYKPSESHGRLRTLLEAAIGDTGANLLWIPPSLPYYPLEGAFAKSDGFSKTLLFSSWVMVPRMVATLVSYEVERRTFALSSAQSASERVDMDGDARRYFTSKNKKRNPLPLLKYSRTTHGTASAPANMTNLTLLYPSLTLAGLIDPIDGLTAKRTLSEVRTDAKKSIGFLIQHLKEYEHSDGEQDRWYWAAPLLLDMLDSTTRVVAQQWLERRGEHERKRQQNPDLERDDDKGAEADHWSLFEQCACDPSSAKLGRMPDDLADVLADLALGSPAILAFRSLGRLYGHVDDLALMLESGSVANAFMTLFNKPEPIETIRNSEGQHGFPYWRTVAKYCASGCLQSVLDEYLHLLKEQLTDVGSASLRLLDTVNLQVTTINVDSLDTFLDRDGQQRRMRCHYAVEFGSQRLEREEGTRRATSLREVFNSPFRPFVLATTSIGQEGLDFHQYCRKLVHWNLPSNPIDFEQREGRINRFKSLVIRQRIARRYSVAVRDYQSGPRQDIWDALFETAAADERHQEGGTSSDLIPYWHIDSQPGDVQIERIVPLYPYSRELQRLDHLLATLALYRLAFGQPRQSELIDHLLSKNLTPEDIEAAIERLIIDLSPIRFDSGNTVGHRLGR